jgi:hypothetical protein
MLLKRRKFRNRKRDEERDFLKMPEEVSTR